MAHWTDVATWKGPTPNQGGSMYEQRGLVIHIAEGYLDGTLAWQMNPSAEVSSHFIVGGPQDGSSKDGLCYQVVDTSTIAWTQSAGNGHWLSIECSGFTPNKLSDKQMTKIAQVFAKGHTVYGWPLQLANGPNDKGLGHHSMGCNNGWGHCDCPGNNIINQKPEILNRAKQIVSGDVALTDDDVRKIWDFVINSASLGNRPAYDFQKQALDIKNNVLPPMDAKLDQLIAQPPVELSDAQLNQLADKVAARLHGLTYIASSTPPVTS